MTWTTFEHWLRSLRVPLTIFLLGSALLALGLLIDLGIGHALTPARVLYNAVLSYGSVSFGSCLSRATR